MSTQNEEPTGEEVLARLVSLGPDKQSTFKLVILTLLDVLESEEGCAVMVADKTGNGAALMMILGNSLLAAPLVSCMHQAMEQIENHDGVMQ